ncbi:hypothetical protein AcW1_003026 [Taiwanofungus camphoratus]|nr:hypothetical protein AcV5_001789 [Antrodia cinnamomea]KAI0925276.1 hypothetical protein AcV7_005557 [Antrodia cinnamomea]KAI0942381.1 hypothetical protein AcW1_003026 [Antrodia cinnamomea]
MGRGQKGNAVERRALHAPSTCNGFRVDKSALCLFVTWLAGFCFTTSCTHLLFSAYFSRRLGTVRNTLANGCGTCLQATSRVRVFTEEPDEDDKICHHHIGICGPVTLCGAARANTQEAQAAVSEMQ